MAVKPDSLSPLTFTDAQIQVTCGKDHISFSAVEDFFEYYNIPLESLHLPNKSCLAEREVIDGVPFYMSRLSKDEFLTCGGRLFVVQLEHLFTFIAIFDVNLGVLIKNPP